MVPAADVLNHLANHNANLEYSPVSGSVPVLVLMCLIGHVIQTGVLFMLAWQLS